MDGFPTPIVGGPLVVGLLMIFATCLFAIVIALWPHELVCADSRLHNAVAQWP